jgi:hypothetical protein
MAKKESESLQRIKDDIQSPDKAVSEQARLAVFIEAANRGEENGPEVKALRKFLDDNKDFAKQHQVFAYSVRHAVMRKITQENGHFELLEREYETRRDSLGWADASPIERLMIERIMLCWLRLLWVENYNGSLMQGGVSIKESEFADRLLHRANSRYIRACESLSRMRLLKQVEREATARADLWDARAGNAQMQKSQNALRLLKAASQGD